MRPSGVSPGVADFQVMKRRTASITSREGQAREIPARLRELLSELDDPPLLIGPAGADALDAFALINKTREKYRARVREVLLAQPDLIPGWCAQEARASRELMQNVQSIYGALQVTFLEITFEQFLTACKTSLPAITQLVTAALPEEDSKTISPKSIPACLPQTTVKGEPVVRLICTKPVRIPPPEVWTPPLPGKQPRRTGRGEKR